VTQPILCPAPTFVFLHHGKVITFVRIVSKAVLKDIQKQGLLGSQTEFFGRERQSSLKPIKPGLSGENRDGCDPCSLQKFHYSFGYQNSMINSVSLRWDFRATLAILCYFYGHTRRNSKSGPLTRRP
jgi:hypothetical protein